MGRILIFTFVLAAAAAGIYMLVNRKSPRVVRDDVMTAASGARSQVGNLIGTASDAVDEVASRAEDQMARARSSVGA